MLQVQNRYVTGKNTGKYGIHRLAGEFMERRKKRDLEW